MLYDTSDMDKGGPEDGDTAALAEGTQLCRTTQLRDMLHCLGGVASLLPLLSELGESNELATVFWKVIPPTLSSDVSWHASMSQSKVHARIE